jgi:hypothetical protein
MAICNVIVVSLAAGEMSSKRLAAASAIGSSGVAMAKTGRYRYELAAKRIAKAPMAARRPAKMRGQQYRKTPPLSRLRGRRRGIKLAQAGDVMGCQ